MSDLARVSFDAATLHSAYAGGLRPEAIVAEAFRRIAGADDPGIFLHLRPVEAVMAEARALPPFDPEAMPLWGLPFAIKDNIDLGGTPTTAGCPAFAYEAHEDAFAVGLLRRAGALALGKTNLDQFATGLVGVRTPYPVPRNAVDPSLVPGGSSSGSAVAVARGIVTFALGTDTAGSGRVPAALNNIVGLKPSLGAISARGTVPACRTLDTISVFAMTVPDAWRVYRVAAAHDRADPFARRTRVPPLSAAPEVRVGVPDAASREFFGDALQSRAFDAALGRLKSLGAEIRPIDFTPFHEVARMLYEGPWVAERLTVVEPLLRDRPEAIHPVTRTIIEAGRGMSAADAFRGLYSLAEIKLRAAEALDGVDLLCVPTIPTLYTLAELDADPLTPNSRLGTYTNFVNLLDLCGIAVPTRAREDGRPGSVTLLARTGRDDLAASWAERLHRDSGATLGATGARPPPAEPSAPGPLSDETEIAVVGAHMSGLPLNHELTSRRGRFLSRTSTTPEYRLYALAGGPPARPGLLRAAEGASIEVETWALPVGSVGDFLHGVPAPLSIGTVRLIDGRQVKGFLVEPAGLDGARDISSFGGWRAFLAG